MKKAFSKDQWEKQIIDKLMRSTIYIYRFYALDGGTASCRD